MVQYESWKRAVVHLEGAATSAEASQVQRAIWEASRHVSDPDEWMQLQMQCPLGRDVRSRGTALFVTHEDRRYLFTARHVLHDDELARAWEDRVGLDEEPRDESEREWPEREREDWIHDVIFRVPSLDEGLATTNPETLMGEFLMNLSAGVSWAAPYSYSTADLDLAIISLDQRDARFADELESIGYEPVEFDSVGQEPSAEGAKISCVGYPESVSIMGHLDRDRAVEHWSSAAVSLPVLSLGHVAMCHSALPFFWADISVYPGNSGGPVIEDEEVVGLVSRQAVVPVVEAEGSVRIPFARVVKAVTLHELIQTQIEKDKRAAP